MTDAPSIVLAGVTYPISPLNLGQLIDLKIAVNRPTSDDVQEEVRRAYMRSIDIIVAALRTSHPTVTSDFLLTQTVSFAELGVAVSVILDVSGLVPKESQPGEAKAEAA